mmetsp:Transcript_45273/g.113979  ORF Transcript_45273/g.113979 Transcript_45273/m.113979 type:complete len:104 (+) Transcript_45273:94-405(+)
MASRAFLACSRGLSQFRRSKFTRGGGDGHAPPAPGRITEEFNGVSPPSVSPAHLKLATFMGVNMWLWILWRLKHDGPVVFGWERNPLEVQYEEEQQGIVNSHH